MIHPYRGVVPKAHPSTWIAGSADVVGDVELAGDSSERESFMSAVAVSSALPHPGPLPRGRGDRNGPLSLGEGEGWGEGGRLIALHTR